MAGINCGEGYYRNENIRLRCNQSQGEESGNFTIHLQNSDGEFTDIEEWNQYCVSV